MIYTKDTKKALKLCFEAHKDQADKTGMPYVFHPFHLAEQMKDEESTIVALLHDVVEDTDYTLEDLQEMGFSGEVIEALSLLTHEKGVPYMDYIAALKGNRLARTVKLADLEHNSDLTRLDSGSIDARMFERLDKYSRARRLLLGGDIKHVKGKYCDKCGRFVEAESNYCPFCGIAISIKEEELVEGEYDPEETVRFCPECNYIVRFIHRYCRCCGGKLK